MRACVFMAAGLLSLFYNACKWLRWLFYRLIGKQAAVPQDPRALGGADCLPLETDADPGRVADVVEHASTTETPSEVVVVVVENASEKQAEPVYATPTNHKPKAAAPSESFPCESFLLDESILGQCDGETSPAIPAPKCEEPCPVLSDPKTSPLPTSVTMAPGSETITPRDPRFRKLHNPNAPILVDPRSFSSRLESAVKRDVRRKRFTGPQSQSAAAAAKRLSLEEEASEPLPPVNQTISKQDKSNWKQDTESETGAEDKENQDGANSFVYG